VSEGSGLTAEGRGMDAGPTQQALLPQGGCREGREAFLLYSTAQVCSIEPV